MRIGYFGDGPWSHLALESLVNNTEHEIAFIVPRFDTQDPVLKEWATKLNVPFLPHDNVNSREFLDKIATFNCDLLISMSFNQILKQEIITQAPLGFINCHAGALPFYRGRNPLNWVLINGEKSFGITVHQIDTGIDTGPIVHQHIEPISENDTYATLLERSYGLCAGVLLSAVQKIARGDHETTDQNSIHPQGSYYGLRRFGDEWLDWSLPSNRIHNFIRAITRPGPGARTHHNDQEIAILETRQVKNPVDYICTAGEVVGRHKNGVTIKTGDNVIDVLKYAHIQQDGSLGDSQIPKWRIGTRLGLSLVSEVNNLKNENITLKLKLQSLETKIDQLLKP